MRLILLAVGPLKPGPEKTLVDDYADRFRKTGRSLGFRSLDLIEVASGGGLINEGKRILAKIPKGAKVLRLDEQGSQWSSKVFTNHLGKYRDQGVSDLVFIIGGAQGYSSSICQAYPDTLAFGPQTWPHRLVRIMLTEQLYRAASLLTGSPYHKE